MINDFSLGEDEGGFKTETINLKERGFDIALGLFIYAGDSQGYSPIEDIDPSYGSLSALEVTNHEESRLKLVKCKEKKSFGLVQE